MQAPQALPYRYDRALLDFAEGKFMQLTNKRIIITGGSRGIGAALVGALVSQGAQVASLDITDAAGGEIARAANARGPGQASYHHCDISNRGAVETGFQAAVDKMGGLDGLVNAAGIEQQEAPEDISDEAWQRILAVNVTGTFLTNQVAFHHLRERGGRILNFGSDAGLMAYPGAAHYSASKGAVISWTRSVAAAWGRFGITVNSVIPAIWTPMYDEHRATLSAEQLQAHDSGMAQMIAIGGKLGDPVRDLAPVIVFLLGDGARFITGQLISVNGGINSTR
jgi:NAD(P)-dependent dehydrogenase (short-subunit alcohol dehydrogenase family)